MARFVGRPWLRQWITSESLRWRRPFVRSWFIMGFLLSYFVCARFCLEINSFLNSPSCAEAVPRRLQSLS